MPVGAVFINARAEERGVLAGWYERAPGLTTALPPGSPSNGLSTMREKDAEQRLLPLQHFRGRLTWKGRGAFL